MEQRTAGPPELAGRVALIAGGGSPGMGRATALALAQAGAAVAVVDINAEGGQATVSRLQDAGAQAAFFQADMTDADAVEGAMNHCVQELGSLDILFNNTGVPSAPGKLTAEFDSDEFSRSIDLNLKSTFLGMRYAIPHMLNAGGGAIVNNASVSGLRANIGSGPYGVAKAGVIQLTKIAALEYAGRGIRINAVCPYSISRREETGAASTPVAVPEQTSDQELAKWQRAQLPMLRSGRGTEVANAVRFLVSDAASWVSGAALPVDGASAAGYFGSFR